MTHDAFLQAIIESPDDDGLRLVYADFLDERGDPRGEFVRVQCQLARLPEADPRRPELEARARTLLQEHEQVWASPLLGLLDGMVTRLQFRRGFIEGATVETRGLLLHADPLFRLAPLRHLQLYLARRRIGQLAALPHLARLTALDLHGQSLGDEGVRAICSSPHLRGLADLRLSWNSITDAGVQVLAACPRLAGLRTLTLYSNAIGDAGAVALARSHDLARLTRVDLVHNPIGEAGRQALRGRFSGGVRLSER
jgi:uncharacterized protein (TIGR02996 family)